MIDSISMSIIFFLFENQTFADCHHDRCEFEFERKKKKLKLIKSLLNKIYKIFLTYLSTKYPYYFMATSYNIVTWLLPNYIVAKTVKYHGGYLSKPEPLRVLISKYTCWDNC